MTETSLSIYYYKPNYIWLELELMVKSYSLYSAVYDYTDNQAFYKECIWVFEIVLLIEIICLD